ncbi:MAG: FeoB-associated Cys-rich membrane protein [Treponema sp.]|nr:FeoB-associated Cys-rich membrane protein [Treponema sp.]
MGTIIISLALIILVALVIASIIKDKRKGRHPSCGGHCASCGHICSAFNQNNLHK